MTIGGVDNHSCLSDQAARVCLPHMMVVALSADSRWLERMIPFPLGELAKPNDLDQPGTTDNPLSSSMWTRERKTEK